MKVDQLTSAPIDKTGLSQSFSKQAEKMGFKTLNQIISVKPDELIHREGFTFHWLSELIDFLEEHHALDLMQGQIPKGKTAF